MIASNKIRVAVAGVLAAIPTASMAQTVTIPASLQPDAIATSVFSAANVATILGFGGLTIVIGLVAAAFGMLRGKTRRIARG